MLYDAGITQFDTDTDKITIKVNVYTLVDNRTAI
jgi:hypothetical protein